MKVGFDYWNVISHHPKEFAHLAYLFTMAIDTENEVYCISAIGKNRQGTIQKELEELMEANGYNWVDLFTTRVHEVVFKHPKESPQLKLEKCQELGIEMFFDDRKDVVDMLNAHGILAFLVPRDGALSDERAERDDS